MHPGFATTGTALHPKQHHLQQQPHQCLSVILGLVLLRVLLIAVHLCSRTVESFGRRSPGLCLAMATTGTTSKATSTLLQAGRGRKGCAVTVEAFQQHQQLRLRLRLRLRLLLRLLLLLLPRQRHRRRQTSTLITALAATLLLEYRPAPR